MTTWGWVLAGVAVWIAVSFIAGPYIGRLSTHKPPAGGKAASLPRGAATAMPPMAVPPAGLNPQPLPRRRREDIAARIDFIRCGCMDIYRTCERTCETDTCREHTFDVAEWEARLRS